MKKIKFSGRETAVLRAIDFTTGTSGEEIMTHTFIDSDEMLDVLNGLLECGYIETNPASERVAAESLITTVFEMNPAYVHQLRIAIARR
jgi:hypothetical protein